MNFEITAMAELFATELTAIRSLTGMEPENGERKTISSVEQVIFHSAKFTSDAEQGWPYSPTSSGTMDIHNSWFQSGNSGEISKSI